MTRALYWTDEDDDQTTLRLDALGGLSKDELRMRPAGVKPLGSVALYCSRRVADGVVCYGPLTYTTDHLGRLVTICTRAICGHVAVVPRVRMPVQVRPCGRCGRDIAGDNAAPREGRDPACQHCAEQRRERQRERDRLRVKLNPRSERARGRMRTILAMRASGALLDVIGMAVGCSGERVRQLLAEHAANDTTTREDAA